MENSSLNVATKKLGRLWRSYGRNGDPPGCSHCSTLHEKCSFTIPRLRGLGLLLAVLLKKQDCMKLQVHRSAKSQARRARVRASQLQSVTEMSEKLTEVMSVRGGGVVTAIEGSDDESEAASTLSPHDANLYRAWADEETLGTIKEESRSSTSSAALEVVDLPVHNSCSLNSMTNSGVSTDMIVTQTPDPESARRRFSFPKPTRKYSAGATSPQTPSSNSDLPQRFMFKAPSTCVTSSAVSSPRSEAYDTDPKLKDADPKLKDAMSALLKLSKLRNSSTTSMEALNLPDTVVEQAPVIEKSYVGKIDVETESSVDLQLPEPEPGPEPEVSCQSPSVGHANVGPKPDKQQRSSTAADALLFFSADQLSTASQARIPKKKKKKKEDHETTRHSRLAAERSKWYLQRTWMSSM